MSLSKYVVGICIVILFIGCSSTNQVSNWKNPDIVLFDAYKVLVVGMTQNDDARQLFETNMTDVFKKHHVDAMRSIDVFDVAFTDAARSEQELDAVEEQLLDKGFDAVLFTKVIGQERRKTLKKQMLEWQKYTDGFKEDYGAYQDIYYDRDYYEDYEVYFAETSLYCICVGKDRKLIWRATIEITDPAHTGKVVGDYVRLLEYAMEEQDLIFRKNDERTSL